MTTPLRKDAARNRELIVAAARGLVDEGTPLQLNDVARRVGVGVGTVYRHFPTTEALLETVAAPSLEALAAYGEEALANTDPWQGFEAFLMRTLETQVTDPSLAPVTAAASDALARTTELKGLLRSTGAALLDNARSAGAVRPDVEEGDLAPLMCGIAHAVDVRGPAPAERVDTARRYLATLLGGLRAAPRSA
ncbi:TetR/AcrR family transcriptional regulator [Streptomyces erythrochromogenes]|uniref:TetR/AcrR family transcriptional regulator n=1 Tax=Streptomyces erythrochromogenes TaxID=285574 RepID=UPI0036C3974F